MVLNDVAHAAADDAGGIDPALLGDFLDAVLSFVIIAAIVYFLVVQPVQRLMDRFTTEPEQAVETRQCPECLSSVPVGASRCAFCTVELAPV